MHALIIEDQFLVAALIEDVLRELGFSSFDLVDTETDAIQAAREKCPELITVDERLSQGSGVNAVRVICAGRAIPVVFITEYREVVREQVPDAVLVGKPFGARVLRAAVAQAIARAGQVEKQPSRNMEVAENPYPRAWATSPRA